MESAHVPKNRRIDKENGIYTQMVYYSATKNMSSAGKWMEVEIMLSEIRRTEKDVFHVSAHMQNLHLKKVKYDMTLKKGGRLGGVGREEAE
jgi:hypothetical protein